MLNTDEQVRETKNKKERKRSKNRKPQLKGSPPRGWGKRPRGEQSQPSRGSVLRGQTSFGALLTTQRESPTRAATKTRTGYWARGHAGDADLRVVSNT